MYNRIDRYFTRQLLTTSLLLGMVFYAIFFIGNVMPLLDSEQSLRVTMLLAMLKTFKPFSELTPTVLFLSFLFAFGGMANAREIVALQALGVSIWQLLTMVLKGFLIVFLVWIGIVEFVTPIAVNQSKKLELSQSDNAALNSGNWLRWGNRFVQVGTVDGQRLLNVNVVEFDENFSLQRRLQAENGVWEGETLQLNQVNIVVMSGEQFEARQLSNHSADTLELQVPISSAVLQYLSQNSEQMFLWELLNYAQYISQNQQEGGSAQNYIFAFWHRLWMPLSTVGLVLLFLPTLLGTPRIQRVSDRLFYGVVVGTLYFVTTEALRNSGQYIELPTVLLASILPWGIFLSGVAMFWRANR